MIVEEEIVVVARVVVPVTVRVDVAKISPAVRDEIVALVVVELPTVRPVIDATVEKSVLIVPVVAVRKEEKRLVEVALVVVESCTDRPVIDASVATRDEMKLLVLVLLVKVASVA